MFFKKDGFGIKLPTKVDMPLSKEIKSKPTKKVPYVEYLYVL